MVPLGDLHILVATLSTTGMGMDLEGMDLDMAGVNHRPFLKVGPNTLVAPATKATKGGC